MKLGIVADAIETLNVKKDSTIAILQAAKKRGHAIFYMQPKDLVLRDSKLFAFVSELEITTGDAWYKIISQKEISISDLELILMRKDPPFDLNYLYTTHLLSQAKREGVLVLNDPQSLRDCNEKLFINEFPACCPPYVVTNQVETIEAFLNEHEAIVVKPLHNMGGADVLRITKENSHLLKEATQNNTLFLMVQKFIDAIYEGDKRVLMIDGEPVPYALARIPKPGDFRGNLAAGGSFEARELTGRDREIIKAVGLRLKEKGLLFVGLDIIGDYLTEINVTSPTCIRQFDAECGTHIAEQLMEVLEHYHDK